MTKQQNIKYLLAVHRALNLTYSRFLKLKKNFNSDWKKIFEAQISDLQAADLDKKVIEKFLVQRRTVSPDQEIEKIEKCGAEIFLHGTKNFPKNLENIINPPVLLFCRGEILAEDFPSIAVVGSRKMTSYGKRAIEKIIGEIAQNGITIVSGLAFGCDICAQKIAIKNGSRTIAVLGNAIDQVYPNQNKNFINEILEEKKGAVISEYLPETEIRPENFPVRNRIIAGLSKSTIVIEAEKKSGSLITAELAFDQGKEVFALPGEIFVNSSMGTNYLISQSKANLAFSGKQILVHLGLDKNFSEQKKAKKNIPTTELENSILQLFDDNEKIHIDDLIRKSALAAHTISSNISILEIKGLVTNLGNQVYVKL